MCALYSGMIHVSLTAKIQRAMEISWCALEAVVCHLAWIILLIYWRAISAALSIAEEDQVTFA